MIAHSIYTKMVTRCYRPKCIVEYDRLAYLRKYNDTRVTFDMNLRATEADFNLFNEKHGFISGVQSRRNNNGSQI